MIGNGSFSWSAGSGMLGAQSNIGTPWSNTLSRPVMVEVTFGAEGRSSGWGGAALARPSFVLGWTVSAGGGTALKLIEVVDSERAAQAGGVGAVRVRASRPFSHIRHLRDQQSKSINSAARPDRSEWIDAYIRTCAIKA